MKHLPWCYLSYSHCQKTHKSKCKSKFFTRQYLKHILLVIFIVILIGLLLSIPIARRTTVNDTTIKYTEPPVEELDTEGYSGQEQPVSEEEH